MVEAPPLMQRGYRSGETAVSRVECLKAALKRSDDLVKVVGSPTTLQDGLLRSAGEALCAAFKKRSVTHPNDAHTVKNFFSHEGATHCRASRKVPKKNCTDPNVSRMILLLGQGRAVLRRFRIETDLRC